MIFEQVASFYVFTYLQGHWPELTKMAVGAFQKKALTFEVKQLEPWKFVILCLTTTATTLPGIGYKSDSACFSKKMFPKEYKENPPVWGIPVLYSVILRLFSIWLYICRKFVNIDITIILTYGLSMKPKEQYKCPYRLSPPSIMYPP